MTEALSVPGACSIAKQADEVCDLTVIPDERLRINLACAIGLGGHVFASPDRARYGTSL